MPSPVKSNWNKHGGGAKVAKSINMEAGINMEGRIFWEKLGHMCNKQGEIEEINKPGMWKCVLEGGFFFQISKHDLTVLKEMRITFALCILTILVVLLA